MKKFSINVRIVGLDLKLYLWLKCIKYICRFDLIIRKRLYKNVIVIVFRKMKIFCFMCIFKICIYVNRR